MKLIPLGTNGFFPARARHTACYLVIPEPRTAIILDAGTGMARLAEPRIRAKLEQVRYLHIVLTHYHLDHIAGLTYLTGLFPAREVILHAPTCPLVDAEARLALSTLLAPPFFSLNLDDLPVRVLSFTDAACEIEGFRLRFRRQRHPGGSVGIRIDNSIAYVTDTTADPETATFAQSCQVLLHEVWLTDDEARSSIEPDGIPAREKHSWVGAVAEIAAKAKVRAVAPIHHPPWRSRRQVSTITAQITTQVGLSPLQLVEGQEYDLDNLFLQH